MNRNLKSLRKLGWAGHLLLLTVLLLPACAAQSEPEGTPEPEIFPLEPVRLMVKYAGKQDEGRGEASRCGIRVDPEEVKISYQYQKDYRYQPEDVEVLWKVYGLKEGHTIFIVAKEGTPEGVFNAPKQYRERDAFFIDSENNAIRSGRVASFPADVMKQDKKIVYWKYDVVVVDERGRELCMVDPQVAIAGHP